MNEYDFFNAEAYLYGLDPVQLSHDRIYMKDSLRKHGVRLIKPHYVPYTPLEQIISEYTAIPKPIVKTEIVNMAWELD